MKVINMPGSGLTSQFSLYHLSLMTSHETVIIFILLISRSGQLRLRELKPLVQVLELKEAELEFRLGLAHSRAHCLNCYLTVLFLTCSVRSRGGAGGTETSVTQLLPPSCS